MTSSPHPDAPAQGSPWWRPPLRRLVTRLLARSPALRNVSADVGEVGSFLSLVEEHFGRITLVADRKDLWVKMQERMATSGESWTGVELGVAQGDATRWWLLGSASSHLVSWHGFDRFVGLPRAWRQFPAGTFDNGGIPPDVRDPRLTWHVGDVEDTLLKIRPENFGKGRRLVLFDLDIYEPTAVAWSLLQPLLRPGDLLYFDEAFDADERRVLTELVLPAGEYDQVATTGVALGLEVRSFRQPDAPEN